MKNHTGAGQDGGSDSYFVGIDEPSIIENSLLQQRRGASMLQQVDSST